MIRAHRPVHRARLHRRPSTRTLALLPVAVRLRALRRRALRARRIAVLTRRNLLAVHLRALRRVRVLPARALHASVVK